ncbi:MAG: acyl-CoA thioesterase [Saprospiraceae bacterium]|nr:acyl-CoA thioesterase [Saprospiraceae bacterium]HRG31710.1 thioesterase family protein [Saprospiraceae bacterium]
MFKHQTQVRVRYSETDRMAYVYYGNYSFYYETGRVEALRSLGLSYKSMEDKLGVFMPVMNMNVRYLRPCYYDELLILETTILHLPERTIEFETKIFKEQNELANQGKVTLCFVDIKTKKRVNAPEVIVDKLKSYFD